MAVATYNLKLEKGVYYETVFTFLDANRSAINLTGFTFKAEVRRKSTEELESSFTCTITDAVNGFFRVIFKNEKFGLYNIGNDQGEISVLDLVKTTEEVMGVKLNYKTTSYPKEYPHDEPRRRCPNISNAKKNLDYYPQVSLKEGLKRHFTWAKNFFNIN